MEFKICSRFIFSILSFFALLALIGDAGFGIAKGESYGNQEFSLNGDHPSSSEVAEGKGFRRQPIIKIKSRPHPKQTTGTKRTKRETYDYSPNKRLERTAITVDGEISAGNDGGMEPVRGPYPQYFLGGEVGADDPSELDEGDAAKHNFRSWNEYTDTKKWTLLGGASGDSTRTPRGYVPVIDPDVHFRDMDKLYKAKNDRVEAFHKLYTSFQRRGKRFELKSTNYDD